MKQHFTLYGIDAPSVVINLFTFGLICLILFGAAFLVPSLILFWVLILYFGPVSITLLATALWMVYSSLVKKPRMIKKAMNDLNLTGNERVLDIGCGRGIFLLEAAQKLTNGKATGIDLWTKDQSGNHQLQTLKNAKMLGVEEKIELLTTDMRQLPLESKSFDVVISNLAIHNVPDDNGREKAMREIFRVLKSGGKFCIFDIQQTKKYIKWIEEHRLGNIESVSIDYLYCPSVTCLKGTAY